MAINECNCKQNLNADQVVAVYCKQSQYDDYFYATIWNGTEAIERQYESTSYGHCSLCGGRGTATVDASADTMAEYQAWLTTKEIEQININLHTKQTSPAVGSQYTVVRGRKIPKGTTGECSTIRHTEYGYMAALKTVTGIVWVASNNLAVA